MIGAMSVGLVLTIVQTAPVCGRVASSAHSIRQHLRELNRSGKDLSPAERLLFSLLMEE
jgi:hypothetical protein